MGSIGEPQSSVPGSQDAAALEHQDGQPTFDLNPNRLWYIHGKAYDLTDWLDNHPGGSYALLNCRGFDVTALFESYHPFTDRPHKLLSTFKPVEVPEWVLKERCVDRSKSFWFYLPDGTPDPFYAAVKERCGKVVKELQIQRLMGWSLFLFLNAILLCQLAIMYFGYLNRHLWVAVVSAAAMALLAPFLSFMAHEAGHGSMVSGKNWFAIQFYEFMGSFGLQNATCFNMEHVILHHSETYDYEDPAVTRSRGVFRLLPSQEWKPIHRLQAYRLWRYSAFSLYALITLTIEPVILLVTGEYSNPPGRIKRAIVRPVQMAKLVIHLLAVNVFAIIIPIWVNWATMENKAILIVERAFVCTVYLTLVGMHQAFLGALTHVAEISGEASSKPTSWAQKGVETSTNYATDSWLVLLLSAGFNTHNVHHLFTGYSADKHHLLLPTVKAVCKEFGVQDIEHQTFASAFMAVERALVAFSQPPAAGDKGSGDVPAGSV